MKKVIIISVLLVAVTNMHAQVKPVEKKTVTRTVDKNVVNARDAMYGNNPVYFSTTLNVGYGHSGNLSFSKRYNTNPAAIIMNGTNLTIKKPGLYHFEGLLHAEVYGRNAGRHPQFAGTLLVGDTEYPLVLNKIMPLLEITENSNSYKLSEPFSIDLYISEPTTLQFKRLYLTASFADASAVYTKGWFTGYLVRE